MFYIPDQHNSRVVIHPISALDRILKKQNSLTPEDFPSFHLIPQKNHPDLSLDTSRIRRMRPRFPTPHRVPRLAGLARGCINRRI